MSGSLRMDQVAKVAIHFLLLERTAFQLEETFEFFACRGIAAAGAAANAAQGVVNAWGKFLPPLSSQLVF